MPPIFSFSLVALPAMVVVAAVDAPEPLAGEAYTLTDEAYKLQGAGKLKEALEAVNKALALTPQHPQLLSFKRDLCFAQDDFDQTETINNQLIKQYPTNPTYRLFNIYLRQRQNRLDEAIQEANAVKAMPGVTPEVVQQANMAVAYVHLAQKDDAKTLQAFQAGLTPESAAGPWLDAAYAAKRLGNEQEARRCFMGALDAPVPAGTPALSAETRFGIRRELESNTREFGFSGNTTLRQAGAIPGLTTEQKTIQQGLEFFWQPRYFSHEGRSVQFYATAFTDLYDANRPRLRIGEGIQGAVGVRIKPIGSENLVFALQRMIKIGKNSTNDWLLRGAYSVSVGSDMKPWLESWNYLSFYTEGAFALQKKNYYQTLEGRAGRSWMVGSKTVFTPYLMLAGDYNDAYRKDRFAGSVGAGISLKPWFRETRHMAPASWLELTLQGRTKLGSTSRSEGIFAGLSFWF